MAKFKVGDKEFETKPLRGREGRAATNYVLKKASAGRVEDFIDLTMDDTFLTKHLPVLVGKEDAKYIDENANTAELFQLISVISDELTEGLEGPEVSAALKNSPATPGEDS